MRPIIRVAWETEIQRHLGNAKIFSVCRSVCGEYYRVELLHKSKDKPKESIVVRCNLTGSLRLTQAVQSFPTDIDDDFQTAEKRFCEIWNELVKLDLSQTAIIEEVPLVIIEWKCGLGMQFDHGECTYTESTCGKYRKLMLYINADSPFVDEFKTAVGALNEPVRYDTDRPPGHPLEIIVDAEAFPDASVRDLISVPAYQPEVHLPMLQSLLPVALDASFLQQMVELGTPSCLVQNALIDRGLLDQNSSFRMYPKQI